MKKNSLIPMTVKACLALATMGCVATANAVLLDFNTLPAGKIVTDDYDDNPDIGLTVTGIGGADLCVLYPSHVSGGSDPDLEGPPFAGGGNAANDFVGNVLIVQEVQSLGGGVNGPTAAEIALGQLSVTPPDDEPGFSIILDFDSDLTSFGFLWVDLDDETGEAAEIIFTDTMGTAGTGDDVNVTVGFEEFLDSGAFPQNLAAGSVGWDDGSADEIERITPAELSAYAGFTISSFDRIRFNCTTSGGLGTLFYDDPNILAVDLVNFTATDDNEDGEIELGWETSSEIDSAAFHVCRAEPSRHRSAKVGQRITANPIPAVGENGGASYSFTDPLLLKDRAEVRGYFLEEIELDGTSNFYGPVWFNGSSVTAVGDWAKY